MAAARLLCAHWWKDLTLPILEAWIMKIMELAEMVKLTTLIRDRIGHCLNLKMIENIDFPPRNRKMTL